MSKNNINPDYMCPRCKYTTNHKSNMNNHLNKKKKPCITTYNNIELTKEIKDYILDNRIYKIPKPESEAKLITQHIATTNALNKFIDNMDTLDKLAHVVNYSKVALIDFEDHVESTFSKQATKLENMDYKYGYDLSQDNILRIVDEVTRNSNSQFNLMMDKRFKRLKMYRSKKWESFLLDIGILELMKIIKSNILDSYEIYLIKQLEIINGNVRDRNQYSNNLLDYYKFIAALNFMPLVCGKTDDEILCNDNSTNNYRLEMIYMDIYNGVQKNVTNVYRQRIKKTIVDIVDKNTLENIHELNKTVIKLANSDIEFKNRIFKID